MLILTAVSLSTILNYSVFEKRKPPLFSVSGIFICRIRYFRYIENVIRNDSKDKCFYCERPFNVAHYGTNKPCAQTRDHIIPISKGGTNHSRNMVYSCIECNNFKGNLWLVDFIDKVRDLIKQEKGFKTVPFSRLELVVNNARFLILYTEQIGDLLYLPEKRRIKKESLVGDYLKRHAADVNLSVNTNTKRHTQEESLYLQRQTVEQFEERKRLNLTVRQLLSDPDPCFHIDQQ